MLSSGFMVYQNCCSPQYKLRQFRRSRFVRQFYGNLSLYYEKKILNGCVIEFMAILGWKLPVAYPDFAKAGGNLKQFRLFKFLMRILKHKNIFTSRLEEVHEC